MPAMFEVRIAKGDTGDWEDLDITSRDVLMCERMYKGVSLPDIHPQRLTMSSLYHLCYVAMRRERRLDDGMTFDAFTEAYYCSAAGKPRAAEEDDAEGEPDPTNRAR